MLAQEQEYARVKGLKTALQITTMLGDGDENHALRYFDLSIDLINA